MMAFQTVWTTVHNSHNTSNELSLAVTHVSSLRSFPESLPLLYSNCMMWLWSC